MALFTHVTWLVVNVSLCDHSDKFTRRVADDLSKLAGEGQRWCVGFVFLEGKCCVKRKRAPWRNR